MSQVTLNVGGRNYTVSCAEGEEAHVAKLGSAIDAKIRQLGDNAPAQESQNLLFAGLLLADELHETAKKSADLEQSASLYESEKAELQRAVDAANGSRDEMAARIADLETELGQLQSAQQSIANESLERDASLTAALGNAEDLERALAASNAALSEAEVELTAARSAAASPPPPAASSPVDLADDLAPALEGFADLLEQCAAKLETRG